MKIIGITGGVGAGKSTILDYLSQKYDGTSGYGTRWTLL